MKRRPQWDNSIEDRAKYRLSYAEQLNRKASYVSKNKEAAREELRKKQELLSKGIIPDEVKKVIAAPPKRTQVSAKPSNSTVKRPTSALDKPKSFNEGRTYVKVHTYAPNRAPAIRTTNSNGMVSQVDTINKLDLAMKELEDAMAKAMEAPVETKSETSFNISSDEEADQCHEKYDIDHYQAGLNHLAESHAQKFGQNDRRNQPEEFGIGQQRQFAQIDYISNEFKNSETTSANNLEVFGHKHPDHFMGKGLDIYGHSEIPSYGQYGLQKQNEFGGSNLNVLGNYGEDPYKLYSGFENYTENHLNSVKYDRIECDLPENKENEGDYLAELLAKTRQDLEAMNVPEVAFEEVQETPIQIPYEEELLPRQFKLQPIEQAGAPRSSGRSIALTDNLKQVKIQTRKFII